VPATTTAAEALALHPDGVFLSNGPGDPAAVTYAINAIREMLGQVPIFGICLGHQLLGLALGAETHKLLFGHRGINQPVIDPSNGAVTITTHNHGFAVHRGTLPIDVTLSRVNLNDQCIEGLQSTQLHAFSVQYHPESAPGPHDALGLFDQFMALIATNTVTVQEDVQEESSDTLPANIPDLRILALADSGLLPEAIQQAFGRWRIEQARIAVAAVVEKRLPPDLPLAYIHLERLKAAEDEKTIIENLYVLAEVIQMHRVETGLHSDYLVMIMGQRLNPWGVIEFQGDFARPPRQVIEAAAELWRMCLTADVDAPALWNTMNSATLDALNRYYAYQPTSETP
jgi:anthranilate/para-aminobenzoate synthase component II